MASDLLGAAHAWFDYAVLLHYLRCSKSMAWGMWLKHVQGLCSLVMTPEDVTAILEIGDSDYSPVASQIKRLYTATRL